MPESSGNNPAKSADIENKEADRNSGYTSSDADDDHFSDAQEGPDDPESATTIRDETKSKAFESATKPSDTAPSATDAPPPSSSGPSSVPRINTVIPPVTDSAIDIDHTPTQPLPERPSTASPSFSSSDPQPIIVRWNDKRDVIRPKVSGEKERIEQLVKQERDRSVSPSVSPSSIRRRVSSDSENKPLDMGIFTEGRADTTSPCPSPHLSPLEARFGRSPARSPTHALSPIAGSAPDTPNLSLEENMVIVEKMEEEPVEVKEEVAEAPSAEEQEQVEHEPQGDVAHEDDETPEEAPPTETTETPVDIPAETPVEDHVEESMIEPAVPENDDVPPQEEEGFGSIGDDDDGFGDDDFDDFGEMGETAGDDDDGFDDFDAFEEADPAETFTEPPPPPPQPQPVFVAPEIPVPILDFETPEGLSQALTAAMDKMFPTDPSLKKKPSVVEGRTFLTERSHSLWNQLCAPPPLQPPNWKVSRIRRLFLVSLGVPVDLDEILPAETKQKKLVLPSVHPVDDYSYTSSRPSSRNDHSSSAAAAWNNNNNNGSRSHHGSASENKDDLHSGSNGKGQARPRSLDVNSARILCSTSDVALEGYTVEELKAHIGKLKETTEMASEVLTFWLEKRNSAMGDKETFETVIESLVGYARKKRQNG